MPVSIKVTGSLPTQVWDVEAAREWGQIVARMMVKRTFETRRDNKDARYMPYTPAYKEELRDAGESTTVDLTRTGALRRGIERSLASATIASIVIEIPSDVRTRASDVSVLRQFWGLAPSNRRILQDEVIGRVTARAAARKRAAARSQAAT